MLYVEFQLILTWIYTFPLTVPLPTVLVETLWKQVMNTIKNIQVAKNSVL